MGIRPQSPVVLIFNNLTSIRRYQLLAVSGEDKGTSKTDTITTGKRINADWNLDLGEEVVEVKVIQSKKKDLPSVLVVLGTKHLFALYDTGTIIFAKKLDFNPVAVKTYKSSEYLEIFE